MTNFSTHLPGLEGIRLDRHLIRGLPRYFGILSAPFLLRWRGRASGTIDFIAKNSREVLKSAAETIQKHHGTDLDTFLASNDEFVRACDAMDQGEWSIALVGLQNCATQVPRNPPTHGNMGICLAALGRKADALAALDRALEMNPDYQPALSNRAIVEQMEEGTPADLSEYRSINYAKEQLGGT